MNALHSLEQVPTANDTSTKLSRFVVGIGASAGELESLVKLFGNLPADTGMAFVVLQHLSPDFKSMMLELLRRDTAMTIHRVEDGMPLEANRLLNCRVNLRRCTRSRIEEAATSPIRVKSMRCRSNCSSVSCRQVSSVGHREVDSVGFHHFRRRQ